MAGDDLPHRSRLRLDATGTEPLGALAEIFTVDPSNRRVRSESRLAEQDVDPVGTAIVPGHDADVVRSMTHNFI